MANQRKKYHSALKHAGFSATTILPGESAGEFQKLHRDIIAELNPKGALEDEIVTSIAHYHWRKRNLATFRMAELARSRWNQIWQEKMPNSGMGLLSSVPRAFDPIVFAKAHSDAEDQARKELGAFYDLVEIGATATEGQLTKDLEIQDRLDAMIDKCYKRLLFLRGLKSISMPSSSTSPKLVAASKVA